MSLNRFVSALPQVIIDINEINPFKKDRFLDSLYFVGVVHNMEIFCNILSFSMNYMPYMEEEMMEEKIIVSDITFGHLLSDSTLYCDMQITNNSICGNDDNDNNRKESISLCSCKYLTSRYTIDPNSKFVEKIQPLLVSPTCQIMAGYLPPPVIPRGRVPPIIHSDETIFDRKMNESKINKNHSINDMEELVFHSDDNYYRYFHNDDNSVTCIDNITCDMIIDNNGIYYNEINNVELDYDLRLLWPPKGGSVIHISSPSEKININHHIHLLKNENIYLENEILISIYAISPHNPAIRGQIRTRSVRSQNFIK
jgi:hypothetical protein